MVALTNKENWDYWIEINKIRKSLYKGRSVIVYFYSYKGCKTCGDVPINELKEEIHLKPIAEVSDGAIFIWDSKYSFGKR